MSVDREALRLFSNRYRYQNVARQVGKFPWFVVAAIHNREALKDKTGGPSFQSVLHNGEKIIGTGRKTSLVPRGRGPFSSWEEAAIDALRGHNLHLVQDWSLERICYELERYNGWGYWLRGDKSSAYLWAGTNIDGGGKFVADGVWSSSAQDQQNGAMPIIKRLLELSNEKIDARVSQSVASPSTGAKPTTPTVTASLDPHRQVGGFLNSIFKAVQAILKRKS